MTPLHTALLHGSTETSRLLAFQRNIKIASPSLAVSINTVSQMTNQDANLGGIELGV